jgi:hypothetical protein
VLPGGELCMLQDFPTACDLSLMRMWLAREPGAGSGERGAGIKRAGSRDCRKKSRNR